MISKISKQNGKEMVIEFHLFVLLVLFLIGPLTCKWAIELIAPDMVESLKQLQVASDQLDWLLSGSVKRIGEPEFNNYIPHLPEHHEGQVKEHAWSDKNMVCICRKINYSTH